MKEQIFHLKNPTNVDLSHKIFELKSGKGKTTFRKGSWYSILERPSSPRPMPTDQQWRIRQGMLHPRNGK
jgi:hypothetical protein